MKRILVFLLAGLCAAATAHAGRIEIDVSVKYFSATAVPATETAALNAIADANRVLDLQGRGLRLKLKEVVPLNVTMALPEKKFYTSATTFLTVKPVSWSRWWLDSDPTVGCDQPPADVENVSTVQNGPYDDKLVYADELAGLWRTSICNNKSTFAYRTNACNVYIIWGAYCGGVGAYPSSTDCTDNLFYVSNIGDRSLFLHEWGHWASLWHPFASAEGTADTLGNDDIADTPTDMWSGTPLLFPLFGGTYGDFIDSVSMALYGIARSGLNDDEWREVLIMAKIAKLKWIPGTTYVNLNASQQAELRLVWQNIESYHKGAPPEEQWLFTEQQLDKVADSMASFATRSSTASGRYWFFGGPLVDAGASLGSSKRPHINITNATLGNASLAAGDVVLGRPGNYPVPGPNGTTLRITKPCTIRATRGSNIPGAKDGSFSIYGH